MYFIPDIRYNQKIQYKSAYNAFKQLALQNHF